MRAGAEVAPRNNGHQNVAVVRPVLAEVQTNAAGNTIRNAGWMDGILHLSVTQHPRKAVALELWAGDC